MKEKLVQIFWILIFFSQKSEFSKKHYKKLKKWKKKFIEMALEKDTRTIDIMKEFLQANLIKITSNEIKRTSKFSPILICVIKNDRGKIELFMKHYRKLGIEVFIFIDNMSTDGTREFICEQNDTICYSCSQEYRSERRVAWINRLIAEYGSNWYLVVDSDEFIHYIGMEEFPIQKLVYRAKEKKYDRLEGFMLDMYAQENMFKISEDSDFLEKCCYFDKNTYTMNKSNIGITIRGGARKRIFNQNMRLSKIPLFYFNDTDIVASSHYMLPKIKNINIPVWFAICHYKFVSDKDYEKVNQAVKNENYSANSADYKIYLKKIKEEEHISFFDNKFSVKLENTDSLKQLRFLKAPFDDCGK